MRIIKEYDERRNEIVSAAEKLFHTKGYEKCTINDILKEVSIAKGTFYYYFKSKKEVLDAVVEKYTALIIKRAEKAVAKIGVDPIEKLIQVFLTMRISNEVGDVIVHEMHKPENALLHQKMLERVVTNLTPILVKVIEEGVEQNIWRCKYPLQYMQILLAASITLMDEGIFQLDSNAQMQMLVALLSLLEKMLEVQEGSFMQLFQENWGN